MKARGWGPSSLWSVAAWRGSAALPRAAGARQWGSWRARRRRGGHSFFVRCVVEGVAGRGSGTLPAKIKLALPAGPTSRRRLVRGYVTRATLTVKMIF